MSVWGASLNILGVLSSFGLMVHLSKLLHVHVSFIFDGFMSIYHPIFVPLKVVTLINIQRFDLLVLGLMGYFGPHVNWH